jgi:hypothetical protein
MRDTMKPLRRAIDAVINGQILFNENVVPTYDEKVNSDRSPSVYILYSTQQETDTEGNDCTWVTRSSIDIEIIARSQSEVSKDVIDDISNDLTDLVLGLPGASGISIGAGLQLVSIRRESAITRSIELSQTESILRKIVKFVAILNQQN